jgi:hypothetical protein
MTDQTPLVSATKNDLLARGIIPAPQTNNGHAAEITWRVAWALRANGAKLFIKSVAQNGWTVETGPHAGQRYSHDTISFPDGWADCLVNAGPPANGNVPAWQWTAGPPPASGTVADPWDLDAELVDGGDGGDGGDDGSGDGPTGEQIAELTTATADNTTATDRNTVALRAVTERLDQLLERRRADGI